MKKFEAKRIFTPLNLDAKDFSVDEGQDRATYIMIIHEILMKTYVGL